MNTFTKKLLIAVFGLTLAAAPLAADAQSYQHQNHGYAGHPSYNTGYAGGNRGYAGPYRGGYAGYRGGYGYRYNNGYYGAAPGGFVGFYWNGGWYHHRRWGNGVYIYF